MTTTLSTTSSSTHEAMAFELEASGQYQVLRKFVPQTVYTESPRSHVRQCMVIDTETTGLKHDTCKIIEIGYAIVTYDLISGAILHVDATYSGLEDPKEPLSEEIIKITGLHDEHLAGKHFNDERILLDLARVSVVVCFNSGFDRPFLESRFPEFASKPFLCAMVDGPWKAMDISSFKQDYLVYKICRVFYDAHRALNDVEVLVHLLTFPAHDGRPIFMHILEKGRQPLYRVWAPGIPFEARDKAKDLGFGWNDGSAPDCIKAWNKLVPNAKETMTALVNCGAMSDTAIVTVDTITPEDRFSSRFGDRTKLKLSDFTAEK